MSNKIVKEIVAEYLEKNGFDGLFSCSECACTKDDLEPCDEMRGDCEAGYFIPKDHEDFDSEEYDYMIGPKNYKADPKEA